jgi:hypothetical protein
MLFKKLVPIFCLQFLLLLAGNCWGEASSGSATLHVIFDIDGTFLAGGKGDIQDAEVIIGHDHFHLAKDIQAAFRYLAEMPRLKIGFYSGSRTAVQKVQAVKIGHQNTALDLANGRILNTPHWMVRIADKPEGTIFENFRKDLTLFESDLDRIIIFEDEWSVLEEQFKNLVHIGKVFPDKESNLEIVRSQNRALTAHTPPHSKSTDEAKIEIWLSHHRAARMVGIVTRAIDEMNQNQTTFVEAAQKANSNPLNTTLYGLNLIRDAKLRWCKQSLN